MTSDKALLEKIKGKRQFWKGKQKAYKIYWSPSHIPFMEYRTGKREKPAERLLRVLKEQQDLNNGMIGH